MITTDNNIPSDLKRERRWVLWNLEVRNGRPTKVPYVAARPTERASVDDQTSWSSYEEARDASLDGKADGIGFVLGDPYVGTDLDKCRDPKTGTIEPAAQEIVSTLDSYTEITPSGTGVHIICRGRLPEGRRRKGTVEMYESGRYFTVTGQHLAGTPRTLEDRTGTLTALHAKLFGPAPRKTSPPSKPPSRHTPAAQSIDDTELIDNASRATNGARFSALWAGDTSAYTSASEADLALCNLLAFWTGADAGQMDRLFRQSGLMREKWDERHGTRSYGEITISRATDDCREVYSGNGNGNGAWATCDTAPEAALNDDDEPDENQPSAGEQPAQPFALVTPDESFVTRYVRYAQERTDAPPEAHELMAVTMLSALAGPTPRLPIATSVHGWRLALWAMYIVNSTVGRKTIVVDTAKDILEQVLGQEALIEWEGSPQGLIQKLQTRDGQAAVFSRDEYSGLLKQINRGGHLAGLEQTLIRAYDGGRIENIRTRKKKGDTWAEDTDRVNDPYLVKLTAATWDSFTLAATIDNVVDGFLARFVFVTGSAIARPLRAATPSMLVERNRLIETARAYHGRAKQCCQIRVPDVVLADAFDLEQAWQAEAARSCRPDAAGPSLKRLADGVLKIAGLLALEEGSMAKAEVEPRHFAIARQMADRWRVSTLRVIDALGRSEFGRNCEAILSSLQKSPSGQLKVSKLYRQLRNLRKRDFGEALDALEMQDKIRRANGEATGGKGRPPQVIQLTAAGRRQTA